MQLRAGAVYIVLFLVIAAGAYAVATTAESPEVTIDEADADHQLSEGDDLTVGDRTYNVSELSGDEGTVEYVNDSAVLEVTWEDEDTVTLEDGNEYTVVINQPGGEDNESEGGEDNESSGEDNESGGEDNESGGDGGDGESSDGADNESGGEDNESGGDGEDNESSGDGEGGEGNESAAPTSFTLREDFDEEEYETVEREDGVYVVVEDEGGTGDRIVPIEEFDEIEGQSYEVGDTIAFNESESEQMVEGEVVEISEDSVTVEYEGEQVTEYDLVDGEVATIQDEEFGVYFPSEDEVYLTSDVDSFEQQQDDVEYHHTRIEGLWWVAVMSVLAAVLIGGLAFMPVRG